MESQNVLGPSMIILRQRLQFEHYDLLIRAPRIENSSSFRLVPEQRAPASGRIVELYSDHVSDNNN